ncbi:MAG: 50S ribosomal protein L24 [Clostridia bacterium]|nr:50S ribosomal protein L24 [Clostridia bacterium]
MAHLHIKKDDTVVVISGNDKGKKGKVIATAPAEGKVIVEGVHVVSKHNKARKQGEVSSIVKTEGAIYASKVLLYCDKCDAPRRTKTVVTEENGKKIKTRVCVKCGKSL